MLIKAPADITASEAATALQAAVQTNHFGITQVHNLKETMPGRAWSSPANA